ncbi:tRNA/rRNA methyltransferase [Spartinivicinus poritis]|uniref:tRNA (cytidine/uridine-2'-O-)-methyltransferase TrmJ n=1 Tax=Spartinivicinus poritis TaxID=2994640 RepID=A0ABT5UFW7_9GAMM|nr:tRNA/rRNA methyltransferase [Spartinivicinus sp. A2-2]MDE1464353.1 tRNA/rRNA methyltransferase [Spartinivicinus sp. A2-2]
MSIDFILVEPKRPENVGAAARALKTMGFNGLRIVNSQAHLVPEAQWVAHGAKEILANVQHFNQLQEATADLDFTVATTVKKRSTKRHYYTPEEVKQLIEAKGTTVKSVGIVFGREESGLTSEEVQHCDIASSIPLANPQPSLNLGQSVMLYAYILSKVAVDHNLELSAPEGQMKALKAKLAQVFEYLAISSTAVEYRWAMERLGALAEKDIHFLHTFSSDILKQFDDDESK